jgi:hypothetical protein
MFIYTKNNRKYNINKVYYAYFHNRISGINKKIELIFINKLHTIFMLWVHRAHRCLRIRSIILSLLGQAPIHFVPLLFKNWFYWS